MSRRVKDRFAERVVVADGAMGSELLARLPEGVHLDLAPLEHPREVLDIHLAYLKAGAELIETATFAASRPRLARLREDELVDAVNAVGVKLAARRARSPASTAWSPARSARSPASSTSTRPRAAQPRRPLTPSRPRSSPAAGPTC